MIVQALIDEDSPVVPLGMESAALLDIYRNQSCDGQHNHGDEACQFAHHNGENDKAEERNTNSSGSECEEPAFDSHELQRTLKPLEYGIAVIVLHISLFKKTEKEMPYSHQPMARASPFVTVGSYLKNMGSASDMAMNATQPPMVIIIVFFTSWSPFCILK